LICDIGKSVTSHDQSNNKILAQDDKFMVLLNDIYDGKHAEFERGYQKLIEIRKSL
jgi:hypothetical protein